MSSSRTKSLTSQHNSPAAQPGTFVLVHGAWHGAWCWQRVTSRLRKRGHAVFSPTLTGLADRSHLLSPAVNLATHVADVVNVIRWEDLSRVVLVGHSYGGVVISRVAEEIPEAIESIVYLDAFLPEDGCSLLDCLPESRRDAMHDAARQSGNHTVPPIPAAVFGVNDRDQAWVDAKCTPQPFATFTDKVSLTGARDRVATKAYIRAGNFESRVFQAAYESRHADPAWETLMLRVGHDAMIDAPVELSEALETLI